MNGTVLPLLVAGLVALSAGALLFALLPGNMRRDRRREALLKADRRDRNLPGALDVLAEFGRRFDGWLGRAGLENLLVSDEAAQLLVQAGTRSRAATRTYMAQVALAPFVGGGIAWGLFRLWHVAFSPFWLEGLLVAGAAIAALLLPVNILRQRVADRRRRLQRHWPDALDIVLLCVEAGMPVDMALKRVAGEMAGHAPDLAGEIDLTTAELAYLDDRARAYENLARRTGLDEVRGVTQALVQAERYGTSLGAMLRSMSEEGRLNRMNLAEKRAAALPPLLTIPLVLFFMPVLLLVIFAPGVIRMLEQGVF